MTTDRPITRKNIRALVRNGCTAGDWASVTAREGFDPGRVRNVHFSGTVRIGSLAGSVEAGRGVRLPAGIYDATLADCRIGDGARVSRVGCLARYSVGEGALVADAAELATAPGAVFGNGVTVSPIDEEGGYEARLFAGLTSQFAYLSAMRRSRPALVEALDAIVEGAAEAARADQGVIDAGARVIGVGPVRDVNIGEGAEVIGAAGLRNGTILSWQDAPSRVGPGVEAADFIIGEGTTVEAGVILRRVFAGQGVLLGKQYSAVDSLFFANCEAFHGEARSLFAGPFTVSRHKSTLLIGCMTSFFNAGSGAHHGSRAAGPGVCHRGCKTGSSSSMAPLSLLGAFSVLIGDHGDCFDASDFPFSYVIRNGNRTMLIPGMNLATVGTARDGEKWPRRDRRNGATRGDQVRFEVMSPYTAGAMLRGEAMLGELGAGIDPAAGEARHKGLTIERRRIGSGARIYGDAIDGYLAAAIAARAQRGPLAEDSGALYSRRWLDVSGLLVGKARLDSIEALIESGAIRTAGHFSRAMAGANAAYEKDAWAWVRRAWHERSGRAVDQLTPAEIDRLAVAACDWEASSCEKILADAEKEFRDGCRFGYGADADPDGAAEDFRRVRGSFDRNPTVDQIRARLAAKRLERIREETGS